MIVQVIITDRPGHDNFTHVMPDTYPSLEWALDEWSPFACQYPGNSRNMTLVEMGREVRHLIHKERPLTHIFYFGDNVLAQIKLIDRAVGDVL